MGECRAPQDTREETAEVYLAPTNPTTEVRWSRVGASTNKGRLRSMTTLKAAGSLEFNAAGESGVAQRPSFRVKGSGNRLLGSLTPAGARLGGKSAGHAENAADTCVRLMTAGGSVGTGEGARKGPNRRGGQLVRLVQREVQDTAVLGFAPQVISGRCGRGTCSTRKYGGRS